MVEKISRDAFFRQSVFADQLIASFQSSYASDFDEANYSDRKRIRKYYDHREPFQPQPLITKSHMVIAVNAANRKDYREQILHRLTAFLPATDNKHFYLLDFLQSSWKEFPFEHFRSRNRMLGYAGRKESSIVLKLDQQGLASVIPLVLFSHVYDIPVWFLIGDNPAHPLALHLCDDGNFHVTFDAKDQDMISAAAKTAGFFTGGMELCDAYSTCRLPPL
ncbi:hypothetical protein [Sediminibacterium soli]|uniref:hypothetical protein n=1 Tax=Sediminibacterium soli TaxID=2698829 RepID=UPI001379C54C|nr:hypothetical protein [Sediminibacterium soli]NCI47476.1 hypothetical protein [Sediminibacterium soli]